jgi:hypothetical protein
MIWKPQDCSACRAGSIAVALKLSKLFHIAMIVCLANLVIRFQLGWLSLAGIAVIALLLYEPAW